MWGVGNSAATGAITLRTWDDLKNVWNATDAVVWVDLESPTAEDLQSLDAIIDLDDEALEDCLDGEPRPRIDDCDDYLLVVAYGVIVPEGAEELESRKLAIFRGNRFLVTIHSEPSRSVKALRARCKKNADAVLSQGVDQMLYRLIDGMVDRYLTLLDDYEEDVEQLEEQSYDPDADDDILHDAARIRLDLIEMRRLVGAQRGLLEPLAEGDFDYMSEGLSHRFRSVRSHLLHAHDRVVGLHERLAAAVQNYHATLAKRTNDVVRTLTVFTAVMLPMLEPVE
jgi:magnesium transporter